MFTITVKQSWENIKYDEHARKIGIWNQEVLSGVGQSQCEKYKIPTVSTTKAII